MDSPLPSHSVLIYMDHGVSPVPQHQQQPDRRLSPPEQRWQERSHFAETSKMLSRASNIHEHRLDAPMESGAPPQRGSPNPPLSQLDNVILPQKPKSFEELLEEALANGEASPSALVHCEDATEKQRRPMAKRSFLKKKSRDWEGKSKRSPQQKKRQLRDKIVGKQQDAVERIAVRVPLLGKSQGEDADHNAQNSKANGLGTGLDISHGYDQRRSTPEDKNACVEMNVLNTSLDEFAMLERAVDDDLDSSAFAALSTSMLHDVRRASAKGEAGSDRMAAQMQAIREADDMEEEDGVADVGGYTLVDLQQRALHDVMEGSLRTKRWKEQAIGCGVGFDDVREAWGAVESRTNDAVRVPPDAAAGRDERPTSSGTGVGAACGQKLQGQQEKASSSTTPLVSRYFNSQETRGFPRGGGKSGSHCPPKREAAGPREIEEGDAGDAGTVKGTTGDGACGNAKVEISAKLVEKMAALEKEVAHYQNERRRDAERRAEQERMMSRERERVERWKVAQRVEMDAYLAEEKKKIKQRRRIVERQAKAMYIGPDRAERAEAEKLRGELGKLKVEYRKKERRLRAETTRLKQRVRELQAREAELTREVRQNVNFCSIPCHLLIRFVSSFHLLSACKGAAPRGVSAAAL